jgi:phenylpropionate dioxygenase-like ring-hydroxylating dioxygenase large terminal subunit
MIEATHWHPVMLAESLGVQPLAFTLLDLAGVLWRDAQGRPYAFADRCPHRGTQLSLGRIVNGRLQCAYHGWQFDGAGQCVHVPALPEFVPPASHCARRFEVAEHCGLLWVRLAAGDEPLPAFEAESDENLRKVNCGPYEVHSSAPRIVENFLDMAHFGFVHEGWLGDLEHTRVPAYEVQESPRGIRATQCRAWQPRSNLNIAGGSMVEYTYEVTAPYTAVLTKLPLEQLGYRESIALFVCPVEHERSRVWFRLAVTDFASSDQSLREFQNTIFAQDKPLVESQTPRRLPLDAQAERHCAADKMSMAYRRYLQALGVRFGVVPLVAA